MLSKTFDNATSCSSDNAVVIEESVYDEMVAPVFSLDTGVGIICTKSNGAPTFLSSSYKYSKYLTQVEAPFGDGAKITALRPFNAIIR